MVYLTFYIEVTEQGWNYNPFWQKVPLQIRLELWILPPRNTHWFTMFVVDLFVFVSFRRHSRSTLQGILWFLKETKANFRLFCQKRELKYLLLKACALSTSNLDSFCLLCHLIFVWFEVDESTALQIQEAKIHARHN